MPSEGRRRGRSRALLNARWGAVFLAAPAAAGDTGPAVGVPREAIAGTNAAPRRIDYDAPRPNVELLDHVRAVANLSFQNWFLWQLSWFRGADWTAVTRESWEDNLRAGFTFDEDELQTNFFGHPYHGGLTFTSARAVGLGFWESASYTLFGSLTWELFAETEPPSINDLLMTTLAGLMLGESTFRLSSQLLDDASSGSWRGLRELAAAVLSPMRGFNRLYMKEAWQSGPSPKRRAIDAAVEVGVEALRATASTASEAYRPSLLLAADISYGDLLPATPSSAFEPFEFFELYAAVSLLNSELSGAQVYTTGLLYGRGIGEEGERRRLGNQHILGFSMTYDFQGSNLATYGGVGLGPVYYWVLRSRQRPSLRLGVGLDLVPILGVTATESDGHQRAYNFGAGAAFWAAVRWHLDTFGELQVRSRQYVTAALDGVEGADYVGATRLSLEVDMLRGVGVGVAPLLVYRRRLNAETDATTLQVQAQAYLKLQL